VREFDNRIPPRGFTNAAYDAFDGEPVGQAYPDGQYWDEVTYPVRRGRRAGGREALLSDCVGVEYVEFLRDEKHHERSRPDSLRLVERRAKSTPSRWRTRSSRPTKMSSIRAPRVSLSSLAKYQKAYAKEWSRCFATEACGTAVRCGARDDKIDGRGGEIARRGRRRERPPVLCQRQPYSDQHRPRFRVPRSLQLRLRSST
jgi:hypothetical protein